MANSRRISTLRGLFILLKIATNPAAYQSVEHIRKGYRRCAYGADSIYYRFNGVEVEIMAILGGQDVDEWL
jgi:toxin ParE1/3/4